MLFAERLIPRRRLSPDDRRNELLSLGAKVFGERPYDEVRIDEIAERAGVSRALMYHYFPDKRAFFAAVVQAESDRLFEATNTPPMAGQTLFAQLREGVLAYLRYDEQHPHGAWAAYVGMGTSDPVLRGIDDLDNDRQVNRIMAGSTTRLAATWTPRWNAISASPCTAGWRSPWRCAGSASSTRRSTQARSPTPAHTRCSMWSVGFRVSRTSSARRSRPSYAVHDFGAAAASAGR